MKKNVKVTPKYSTDQQSFVIRDSVTGQYRPPMLAVNEHDIIRQITSMLRREHAKSLVPIEQQKEPVAPLFENADQFTVFSNGYYDRQTGLYHAEPLSHICNIDELKQMIIKTAARPN